MVEAGKVTIAGNVETKNIEEGFTKIKSGFKGVENQANQTNASMARAANITKKLATNLKIIGIAGATAMTALATKSPVMANTMAKIDVSLLKLSNTVGRQLQPVFEGFNSLINNFNSFLSGGAGGDPDSIFKGMVAGGGVGAITGGIIGFILGGPAGMMTGATIGGTLGSAAGSFFGSEISKAENIVSNPEDNYFSKDNQEELGISSIQRAGLNLSYTDANIKTGIIDFFGNVLDFILGNEIKFSSKNGVTR